MLQALNRKRGISWLVVFLFLLSGCATQLAPAYDKAVVDGLLVANTEVMTLLAKGSQGTSQSTFSERENAYNTIVGKFDGLVIQAAARPIPKTKVSERINGVLEKRGIEPLQDDDATPPSVQPLKKVVESLTKMRDTDKKQGLTATEVLAFKGQIVILLDQATTYENFLQR
jgi:hypothetical protein